MAAMMAFILFACSEKIVNENGSSAKAVFRAYVGQSSGFEAMDLFVLTVTGPDFKPITANLLLSDDGYLVYQSVGNDIIDTTLEIPVGRNRLFTIEAFDTPATGGPGQTLIYRGEQRADVYPGVPVAISVVLQPMVPMIRLAPRTQTQLPLESFPVAVEAYHLPDVGSASIYINFPYNDLEIDSVTPGAGLEARVPDLSFDEGGGEGYHYVYAASGNSNLSLTNNDGYAQLAVIYFTGAYTGQTMYIITDIVLGEGEGGIDGTDGQGIEDVFWDGAKAIIAVDFSTYDPLLDFPDYDLETAIMEYSGADRGNIHLSDVFGIGNLTWDEHEILDLTGLNQLPNLRLFSARYCGATCLSDISGVAGCPELEYLNLAYNDITDISALAGLNTLEHLDLSGNDNLEDISALANLANLSYVDLAFTAVTSLQVLVDNTGITAGDTVNVSCTEINGGPDVTALEERGVMVWMGCK